MMVLHSCLDEPIGPLIEEGCVLEEEITYQDIGVLHLYKGGQEEGFAVATKLNVSWESSAKLIEYSGKTSLILTTWWGDSSFYFLGEKMIIKLFPTILSGCYELKNESSFSDSLSQAKVEFILNHDDVIYQEYILDPAGENEIEIILDDRDNGLFKAKFNVSFIPEFIEYPKHPSVVRFFNGEIHIDK